MVFIMSGINSATSLWTCCLYSWYISTTMMGSSASTLSDISAFGIRLYCNTYNKYNTEHETNQPWWSCSSNIKCLRLGHWLTLCTLNIHLLTYLLISSYNTDQQPWKLWKSVTLDVCGCVEKRACPSLPPSPVMEIQGCHQNFFLKFRCKICAT